MALRSRCGWRYLSTSGEGLPPQPLTPPLDHPAQGLLAWLVHRSAPLSAGPEAPKLQPLTAVAIIPARLQSTRLPEKPLQDLGGAPLIARVLERVRQSTSFHTILVATDSPRIADAARNAGAQAVMTSPDLPSGLDRVAAVARDLEDEIIVNIQGDEPFVNPEGLEHLVSLFRNPDVIMGTLAAP